MNKNNIQNKTCTLDKKHAEMVEKFKNNEEKIIPKLLNEIEKNEIMLNKLINKNNDKINNKNNKNNDKNNDKIILLENTINNLKKRIINLNNEKKKLLFEKC